MALGIIPWEILDNNFFTEKIEWHFYCNDQTIQWNNLKNMWIPDEHDLVVKTNIAYDAKDDKARRILDENSKPKWQLSWKSDGTKICGSSPLSEAIDGIVRLECQIPKGSCKNNLKLEPVAIVTKSKPDEFGIYSIPPGSILTEIEPLTIKLDEISIFPFYEKKGDGSTLLTWNFPHNLYERLDFNIQELISVEVDINHPLIKRINPKDSLPEKQKFALIYLSIITEYIQNSILDKQLVDVLDENHTYQNGSAGEALQWLLGEIRDYFDLHTFDDLRTLFLQRPLKINFIVDKMFSKYLLQ